MATPAAGASYECPLVLDGSPFRSSNTRKRKSIICIDDDSSDEDRKMAAKRPRRSAPRSHSAFSPATQMTATSASKRARLPRFAAARLDSDTEEDDDEDAALARQLQQEEWGHRRNRGGTRSRDTSLDALLKAKQDLDQEDDELNQLAVQADASLAAKLQKEEQAEKERRMQDEQAGMTKSLDGRAWLFVNQVLELHKNLSPSAPGPETVSVDDMVFLGKNFLQCIQDFEQNGWPARVTLKYHYTSSAVMDKIKQDGLMTHAERKQSYSSSTSHGAVFGDGIYTANNPFGFRHFGDTGLLVAVVLGNAARVSYGTRSNLRSNLNQNGALNTVIGNKSLRNMSGNVPEETQYYDEYVLQESKQCLPLMKFNTTSVSSQAGKDAVWEFHQELQKLLDRQFNKSIRTELKRVHESTTDPLTAIAIARGSVHSSSRSSRRTPTSAASRAASLAAISAAVVPPPPGQNPAAPQAGPTSLFAPPGAGPGTFAAGASQAANPSIIFAGLPGFGGGAGAPPIMFGGGAPPPHVPPPPPPPPPFPAAQFGGPTPSFSMGVPFAAGGTATPRRTRSSTAQSASFSMGTAAPPPAGGAATTRRRTRSSTAQSGGPAVSFSMGGVAPLPTGGTATPRLSRSARTSRSAEVLSYTAPQTLMAPGTPADVFVSCKGSDDDCVICMESLSGPSCGRVVKLKECGHEYHKKCIKDALKAKACCPVCRVMLRKPQGMCPSGTMSITTTSSIRCGGFEGCRRSIVITYSIPNGLQHSFHENPGQSYQGATRVAYLPDNEDGQKLLKRLKFAWNHGLTFTVGTSLTTRQPNCVTWASIHHKTSPSGGTHGFPDLGFFVNCNAELDAAGVPKE